MERTERLILTLLVTGAIGVACGPDDSDDGASEAATPAVPETLSDPLRVVGIVDSLRAAPLAPDLSLSDPALFTYGNPDLGVGGELDAGWCFSWERQDTLADASVVGTTLYFGPPEVPDDLALPGPAEDAGLPLRYCRLGMVSRSVLTSPNAAASLTAAREALVARYGSGTQWTSDGYTIELAVGEDGLPVVRAYASADEEPDSRPSGLDAWEAVVGDVMAETAALTPDLTSSLDVARVAVADGMSGPDELAHLLSVMRQMTTPVPTRADGVEAGERHAARLALLDGLLRDDLGPLPAGSPAIDSLETLGVRYDCRLGECVYGGSLINLARARSRYPQRTARLAESVIRFRGCVTYGDVIRALESRADADALVGGYRRYLLGMAYATLVGLGLGAGDQLYFPASDYADLAEVARSRALDNLMAALEGDLDSTSRDRVWQTAFRLLTNLGVEATYACARQQRCEDPGLRTLAHPSAQPTAEEPYDFLPPPYSLGIGLLRPELPEDRATGWEYEARLPLFDAPGRDLLAWIFDGWLLPQSGAARPLGHNGMVGAGSELLNWIVEERRDDGWLRMRYAPGESGLAWTHECMFAVGPDPLALVPWENILTGGLWLLRDTSQPLREAPADDAPVIVELSGSVGLFRRELRGDWMRVEAEIPDGHCGIQTPEVTYEGWIRWRDASGEPTVRNEFQVC